eukprot:sb/3477879/
MESVKPCQAPPTRSERTVAQFENQMGYGAAQMQIVKKHGGDEGGGGVNSKLSQNWGACYHGCGGPWDMAQLDFVQSYHSIKLSKSYNGTLAFHYPNLEKERTRGG